MTSLFDRYPLPWVCTDNAAEHEGIVTIFDRDGGVVMPIADMEGCSWEDILLGYMFAASGEMFKLLVELHTWLTDYENYAEQGITGTILRQRIAALLLLADYETSEAQRFPPPPPDAPPPISIIPERRRRKR